MCASISYWDWEIPRLRRKTRESEDDVVEEFRVTLRNALRQRLVAMSRSRRI